MYHLKKSHNSLNKYLVTWMIMNCSKLATKPVYEVIKLNFYHKLEVSRIKHKMKKKNENVNVII